MLIAYARELSHSLTTASRSVLVAALISGLLVSRPVQAKSAPPALPDGLPARLGIGLAAHADSTGIYGWMPESGVPWDYAYQYLAGGVNTGSGWETWNDSGQFPLFYAQGSAARGYVPVFSYYELLQSKGLCGECGEAQKNLSHLNDPGLMAAYYQNFALLMKRLGPGLHDGIQGFGGTAIVHVEPDLAGFAQQVVRNGLCFGYCTGRGNDPALLSSMVDSSGVSEVAGFPDTYQGFNWALLHLRDLYAPNVLLAQHLSNWATGQDIGSSHDPSLDATRLGNEAGAFLALTGMAMAPPGVSTYDLLFDDPLDRDAGFYKNVLGNPNPWWDRLNVSFPNFHRWEEYVGSAVTAAGGKPAIIWQIPLGNQHFRTMNNSWGHYQDNRSEYFFAHLDELVNIGVVALLFGAGAAGNANNWDAMGDGITNPEPFCTTDGLSSGEICNDQPSTYADDDGGYIRFAAQAYYQQPVPLTPAGVPPPTAAPQPTLRQPTPRSFSAGASVSPNAIARDGTASISTSVQSASVTGALVDVEIYDPSGAKVYQQFFDNQSFSAGQARTFLVSWRVPATAASGSYTIKIGVFSVGWGTLYHWSDAAAQFSVR